MGWRKRFAAEVVCIFRQSLKQENIVSLRVLCRKFKILTQFI